MVDFATERLAELIDEVERLRAALEECAEMCVHLPGCPTLADDL